MDVNAQVQQALAGLIGGEAGLERLKAITARGAGGIDAQGLVPQFIDLEAHNWLWGMGHFRFIRSLPEVGAKAIKHDWEAITQIGGSVRGGGAFTGEGSLGKQRNFKARPMQNIMGIMSHQNRASGTARAVQQVKALGYNDAFLTGRQAVYLFHYAVKTINVVHGRSDVYRASSEERARRYAGLFQQHEVFFKDALRYPTQTLYCDPQYVVDLRGKRMSRKTIEQGSLTMVNRGWGSFTHFYCDPAVAQHFTDEVENNNGMERISVLDQGGKVIAVGAPVGTIRTLNGEVKILPEQWFHPQHVSREFGIEDGETPDQNAPAKPAAPTAVVGNAGADAASKWQDADIPAGDPVIKYKLQPENVDGMGYASNATAAVAIDAAAKHVDLSWVSSPDVDCYHVLRNTADNPTEFYVIGSVKNDGPNLTFRDRNWIIPGTSEAFGLQMGPMKGPSVIDLPNTNESAIRLATLRKLQADMLGKHFDGDAENIVEEFCPELRFPYRMIRYVNIGNR